jgi:O-succinylbenzoate synthase
VNITDISILALPMRTRFRSIETREIAIFKGERWSEFSPFIEHSDQEAAVWLKAALTWANEPLPELIRDVIPVNATLPAVAPAEIKTTLAPFGNFTSVKIKVAEKNTSIEDDLARINALRELYPKSKIKLDANGAFSVEQALDLCQRLRQIEIEYFEQPVSSIEEMKQLREELLRNSLDIKLAADELIRKTDDPYRVAKENAADIAVLKAQPLGGVKQALEIAAQLKMDVVVSSALESSIGLMQGLHLAGSLPELRYDCGLATASLLKADVVAKPLTQSNGKIEIRSVEPDQELVKKYEASTERRAWWLARIERCSELLES